MKNILKIIGILLFVIGLVDLIGSYTGFDLWTGFLGIELPELVWRYSAYGELGLGYLLFSFGSKSEENAEPEAATE
jgi:hypothetical protein